jgi:hypothetical protein
VWFALLSQAALWLVDVIFLPGAPNKFTSDPTAAGSIALAALLAGVASCWSGFRHKSSGTSIGFGTGILSILVNPFAWVISLSSFLLLPIITIAIFTLGGVVLEITRKAFSK